MYERVVKFFIPFCVHCSLLYQRASLDVVRAVSLKRCREGRKEPGECARGTKTSLDIRIIDRNQGNDNYHQAHLR